MAEQKRGYTHKTEKYSRKYENAKEVREHEKVRKARKASHRN